MYKKASYSDYVESAEYITNRLRDAYGSERGDLVPDYAIILGSGLGDFAEKLEKPVVIPYREIPHFPVSTVSYQKGELVLGFIGDKLILTMNGRFHYYEGWEMWQTAYPVGVFKLLGVEKMIITNAAGGIGYNDEKIEPLRPGDLVAVTDHIKLAPDSPSRGEADFGPRFFDMQRVYDRELRELAKNVAGELGFELREGIYAYMSGPQYETPAEIRALKLMGANLVGMSTVAEVISAAQHEIRVLCISCVTNMAAGMTGAAITSEEVLDTTKLVHERFDRLVETVVKRM